jgi:hypothetical protein
MRIALVLVVLIGSLGCAKDATKDLEQFADRACACADKKDASCAQGVLDDLVKFANQNKHARGDEDKAKAASQRMGMCLVQSGLDPATMMSKLQDLGK